ELLLDNDKPRGNDRTLWTAATPALSRGRWRCASSWRRCRTALGLKEVSIVRHRINGDRLRAGERVDGRNHRVVVGRILVDDCDVALTAIRNVDQFLRRIPSQGINAR